MRLNYFASNRVLEGAKKLSEILRAGQNEECRREAQVGLLELGGAAFEASRYSLALEIADVILLAGIELNAARKIVGDQDVAAFLQIRTAMVGAAFRADVEAAVKRYLDWIENLLPIWSLGLPKIWCYNSPSRIRSPLLAT
jgi:hypothetical protein